MFIAGAGECPLRMWSSKYDWGAGEVALGIWLLVYTDRCGGGGGGGGDPSSSCGSGECYRGRGESARGKGECDRGNGECGLPFVLGVLFCCHSTVEGGCAGSYVGVCAFVGVLGFNGELFCLEASPGPTAVLYPWNGFLFFACSFLRSRFSIEFLRSLADRIGIGLTERLTGT